MVALTRVSASRSANASEVAEHRRAPRRAAPPSRSSKHEREGRAVCASATERGQAERLADPVRAEADEERRHRDQRHHAPEEHGPGRGLRAHHQHEGASEQAGPHRRREPPPARGPAARHGSTRTETLPSQPASSLTSIPAASGSATVAAPASTTLPGGSDWPRAVEQRAELDHREHRVSGDGRARRPLPGRPVDGHHQLDPREVPALDVEPALGEHHVRGRGVVRDHVRQAEVLEVAVARVEDLQRRAHPGAGREHPRPVRASRAARGRSGRRSPARSSGAACPGGGTVPRTTIASVSTP